MANQPTCRNAKKQRLNIKNLTEDCPQWRNKRRKYNIICNIEIFFKNNNEVGELMYAQGYRTI